MTLWPTSVAVTGVQLSVYDSGDEFSNTCIGTHKEYLGRLSTAVRVPAALPAKLLSESPNFNY